MNPLKVSAEFAAYIWFTQKEADQQVTPREAARFAKNNWIAFLPCADKGIGRLLIEIAKPRPNAGRRPTLAFLRGGKRVCDSELTVAD